MAYKTKLRTILAKTEGASYGVNAAPDGTNAVLVNSDLALTPLAGNVVSRDIIRPYMGAYEGLMSDTQVQLQMTVEYAGSGTAGTAPRYAPLLRSSRLSETVMGTALTGTATAGGAGTITLAAGSSAVNDAYTGMVITITAGTGINSIGLITQYVGSTKIATVAAYTSTFTTDNTSAYSIGANVRYMPISTIDGVSDTSCTIQYRLGGPSGTEIVHTLTGCRATASFNHTRGQIPTITFNVTGIYNAPTDASPVTPTYANQTTPKVFRNDTAGSFRFFGVAGCLESNTLDFGNQVEYRELIGCSKEVLIVDGAMSGTVVMETTSMATFNPFEQARTDGALGRLAYLHGTTAGNRIGLVNPYCDLGLPAYQSAQGVEHFTLPYTAVPSVAGNDELIICYS
jgi:hypothetical protein